MYTLCFWVKALAVSFLNWLFTSIYLRYFRLKLYLILFLVFSRCFVFAKKKKRQWMWNEFYYWFKGNGKNETLPSEVFYCLAKSFEVVIRIILTWMEAVATNLYVALLCLHFILPKCGFYTWATSIRENMVVNFFVYPRAYV